MKKVLVQDSWQQVDWYGFDRYNFKFENFDAWIVFPHYPAGDGRWSWCMVWPEAYVKRVGILELLEHGFYHVHIDLFATRANPEGIGVMNRFQDYLISLGLSEKCCLIGMSWGGYFSLRYTTENPQRVASLYIDAPVCDAAEDTPRRKSIEDCYKLSGEELETSKLNPLNALQSIVAANIPVLAIVGEADVSVNVETNFNELERRYKALGGNNMEVIRRAFWGHHPHGLDEPEKLLAFHCGALQ